MAGIRRLHQRLHHHRRRLRRGCPCSQVFSAVLPPGASGPTAGMLYAAGHAPWYHARGAFAGCHGGAAASGGGPHRNQHARRPTSQASPIARIAGHGRTTVGSNAPGGVDGVHSRGPPRHEDFLRHLGYLCFAGLCALPGRVSRLQRLHLLRTPKEHRPVFLAEEAGAEAERVRGRIKMSLLLAHRRRHRAMLL